MPRGKSQHRRKTKTHTKLKSPPHGRDVFQTHWSCSCQKCEWKRAAVSWLVKSFSHIPRDCAAGMVEQSSMSLPLPMWGTLFVPSDPVDAARIRRMCRPITGADGDEELQRLELGGWKEVANTGVLAVDFLGALILGIHGAGYNFFPAHWEPLYDALEYEWHL
ncbi:MAG: hypothetical protein IT428_09775 [Planctomycetaceae bacterium]|nr:hypothetical protein [Planctomycetaceae bacterium]